MTPLWKIRPNKPAHHACDVVQEHIKCITYFLNFWGQTVFGEHLMCWLCFFLLPSALFLYFHSRHICVFLHVTSMCRKGDPRFFFLPSVWKETIIMFLLSLHVSRRKFGWMFLNLFTISVNTMPTYLSLPLSLRHRGEGCSLWKVHLRFSWHSDNKRAAWAGGKMLSLVMSRRQGGCGGVRNHWHIWNLTLLSADFWWITISLQACDRADR